MKHLILIFSLLLFQFSFSQKIITTGGWTDTFNASSINIAGKDYDANYLSATNQTTIDAQPKGSGKRNSNKSAEIHIHKTDIDWHPDLKLEAKVTSQIHGNQTGTNFQDITDFERFFFEINYKVDNIPIQYRITGLSVTLPVKNYTTEVVYTIFDN
ncbi:MAG TPA: hypothetical protein VJ970_02310 [Flavobacteriaceae bacterium]|nr:hypothetical protein [Flavobacteriaceae bacterium]